MARDAPPTPRDSYSGLYARLLEREEAEPTRHPQRLAALRAGRPVDICAGNLPQWARVGEETHRWRRARVTAAGAVTFYEDDGSAWLEDNRL
jgi:hypothetical protein